MSPEEYRRFFQVTNKRELDALYLARMAEQLGILPSEAASLMGYPVVFTDWLLSDADRRFLKSLRIDPS